MEILVIGSPNGNTANLLAPNNCCKVRTERVGGRCLWGISSWLCAVEGIQIAYLSNFVIYSITLKMGEKKYNCELHSKMGTILSFCCCYSVHLLSGNAGLLLIKMSYCECDVCSVKYSLT